MSEVTEIEITPIKPKDGLVGFASVLINNELYLGSIGVHSRLDGSGYRITYPTKKVGDRNLNIYHPIDRDLSSAIETAICNKFKEVMEKCNDRHNSFDIESGPV